MTQTQAVAATDDVRMIQTQLKLIQLQQSDLLHRQHSLLAQQVPAQPTAPRLSTAYSSPA